MRKILLLLFVLTAASSIKAQTITLGPVTNLAYCVGDTIVVSYQSGGNFATDNAFVLQFSDVNGNFSNFTNTAQNAATTGILSAPAPATGLHYRVRVISTDPYTTSADNGSDIQVHAGSLNPDPCIIDATGAKVTILGQPGLGGSGGAAVAAGFAGELLHFAALPDDTTVTAFLWQFNNDVSDSTSNSSSPSVSYSTDGIKTGTLTLFNSYGCASTSSFWIQIVSCNPIIPNDAQIIKSSIEGDGGAVWVQAGGNYTMDNEAGNYCQVYVEPGGSVITPSDYINGVIYVRAGGSIVLSSNQHRTVVLEKPLRLTLDGAHSADTFYCDNLTFDYSQVLPSVVQTSPPSNLTILQSADHLFANDEGLPMEIHISNLLGSEVLSEQGSGTLDVDLSSLPAGVYFAVVEAGNQREVQKIAVLH